MKQIFFIPEQTARTASCFTYQSRQQERRLALQLKEDGMKRIFFILITISFIISLSATPITARYIKTDTQNYPLNISSVQVLDSSDEPVKDLTEKNFRVIVDSKMIDSLRTTTYEKTGQGLHIMLCLDASGSMRGEPIQSIKNAIIPFINKIRSVDKVAISVYADDYQLLADFTNERTLLKNTINNITPKGNFTSLYYGADKAIEQLVNVEDRTGKILILMGDGKDENPTKAYSENDIIQIAKNNGIPIFTIGYSKVEEVYLQSLERMAESTGGSYYYAPTSDDLVEHYNRLYRQIMNINLLSYIVVGVAGDGAEHNLGIVVKTTLGTKELAAKFVAPAGRPAYLPVTPLAKKQKVNPVILLIILGALVIITGVVLFLRKRARKNKQKRDNEIRLLEEQKQKEIDAERQKREALEKELSESKIQQATSQTEIVEQRKPEAIKADRERTMIMGAGQSTQSANGILRMEIIFGTDMGKVYSIDKTGSTIGRADDNRIILTDNTVSSHHAKIYYEDGFFLIEDVGSTNGIFINGNKVQLFRLESNCTFKLGSVEGNFNLV